MMEFGPECAEVLEQILRWRSDVRHFGADPVPESLAERLRRTMDFAPFFGNARHWRVIRVCNADLRPAAIFRW